MLELLVEMFYSKTLISSRIIYEGWGLFEFQVQSDVLRQIDLTIHSSNEGLLFTYVGPNGEDVCAGDSGKGEDPGYL